MITQWSADDLAGAHVPDPCGAVVRGADQQVTPIGGGEVGNLGGMTGQDRANRSLGEEVPDSQGGLLEGGYHDPAAVQAVRQESLYGARLGKGADPLLSADVPYVNDSPSAL